MVLFVRKTSPGLLSGEFDTSRIVFKGDLSLDSIPTPVLPYVVPPERDEENSAGRLCDEDGNFGGEVASLLVAFLEGLWSNDGTAGTHVSEQE